MTTPGKERSAELGPTAVTIYGRTYHLRGGGDPAYLRVLAEVVDGKMRDVASATGTADTLKVAILAALNLADDAAQGRGGGQGRWNEDDAERLERMVRMIDEALAG